MRTGLVREPAMRKDHHAEPTRFQHPGDLGEDLKGPRQVFHGQAADHGVEGAIRERQDPGRRFRSWTTWDDRAGFSFISSPFMPRPVALTLPGRCDCHPAMRSRILSRPGKRREYTLAMFSRGLTVHVRDLARRGVKFLVAGTERLFQRRAKAEIRPSVRLALEPRPVGQGAKPVLALPTELRLLGPHRKRGNLKPRLHIGQRMIEIDGQRVRAGVDDTKGLDVLRIDTGQSRSTP